MRGQCLPKHRHEECLVFLRTIDRNVPKALQVHLILDNYHTHKHPETKAWLAQHPRIHLHFTLTSSSWLNLVERWFSELADKKSGVDDDVTLLDAVDFMARQFDNRK